MDNLFEVSKLKKLTEEMVACGPRFTGSSAHEAYIDILKRELTALGCEIKSDRLKMKLRWEPVKWKLTVTENGAEREVPDVSYYPYSGVTPPEGVSGKLVWCGKNVASFIAARGKIAVTEMSVFDADIGLVFKKRGAIPSNYAPPAKMASPVVSSFVFPPDIKRARLVGVKGVICIMSGCSDGNAAHQYLPFITYYQGIPALWVNATEGEKIKAACRSGGSATLILEATLTEKCESETIYTVLEGKNKKETVIINTHTDGTNAFEENGGIGSLSMIRHFLAIPKEQRERTLIFSFVTGHFQIPQFGSPIKQATNRFLSAHKDLWDGKNGHAKAVAGVSIEHFGCTEWHDDASKKNFVKVDDVDPELVFTANAKLEKVYLSAAEGRRLIKTLTLKPKNFVYFGEGQPMYMVGIPTISLVPGPDYLCTDSPDGYIDKINYDLFKEQVETFTKVVERLDKLSEKEIGKPELFTLGVKF